MTELYFILLEIILPIFVLVGAGIYLERRFKLDIATMSKLNFFIFVPALLFKALIESSLEFESLVMVALFQVALITVLLAVNWGVTKAVGLDGALRSAFLLATAFCNSGNFGVPLIALAFADAPDKAVSYQSITLMVQNLLTFTLGLLIVGHGRTTVRESVGSAMKLPFVYVIVAALTLRHFDVPVRDWPWVWVPISRSAEGLVAVALLTLGIQVAKTPRIKHVRALSAAVVMRLVAAPLVAFGLVKLFGFTGMLAHVVVIASAGPAAVNTVLIGLEYDNEPDFAASAVFYTTLLCGLTVALTIYLVRHFM